MTCRAVITGIGVIAPGAATTEQFWGNCLEEKAPLAPVPDHWRRYAELTSTIWAPLPRLDFTSLGISRVEQMQLDTSSMLALCAARQAIDNARLSCVLKNEKKNTFTIENLDARRSAVFCGSGIGGLTSLIFNQANHILTPLSKAFTHIERIVAPYDGVSAEASAVLEAARKDMRMPGRFNPFIVSMTMPNACSANVGIKYSLTGPNTTFCCACAAGTVAIGHALESIRSGAVDCALCGGVEYLGDEFGGIFRGFDCAKTLVVPGTDPASANRPFDRTRSGFLFAEGGACMLIVEELGHALRRNAPIIAEVKAFAETFDGNNIMMMDPQAIEIRRMLSMLLERAGLDAGEIDYINAHGTGTVANDEIEARVIGDLFGSKPYVNSTKSLIGHSIGAGGAIETAVTALSISRKTTHACKNLKDPVSDLNFVRSSGNFPIRKAVTHSFAFGGHNAGLILEEYR